MSAKWQQKLADFGITPRDDGFEYPAAPDATDVLCTLESDTVLHISGEDAEVFLQGQFSNDIAALADPSSQLSTWSSPKGRVITVFRIMRIEDGYLLKMPTALLEPVLKRLRMYVLMSKVVIEPREDLVAIGISGEAAAAALTKAGMSVPQNVDDTAHANEVWITRVRGAAPRFEVIGQADHLEPLWIACRDVCQAADESVWRLQNIDAGIPSVGEANSEAFVLQMMNLQFIDGVNFKKGCFPGQEVVARLQYLGKLKRQMFRFQYDGGAPAAGDDLYKNDGGSAAGTVVDAVNAGDGISRLLAVVAVDAAADTLYLDKEAKQSLKLLDLPYSLTPAE